MTSTIYHVRHSCGHAVFWDDSAMGMSASSERCPWCGAETGNSRPPEGVVLHFTVAGRARHIRQNPRMRCKCEPVGTVIARHLADDSCCPPQGQPAAPADS